ncbi:MAG: hypothetical protein JRC86_10835 [Deltaproteobacteria bacterium]|nr:hypothetical protein [Deltaproteobacteria bacterium]
MCFNGLIPQDQTISADQRVAGLPVKRRKYPANLCQELPYWQEKHAKRESILDEYYRNSEITTITREGRQLEGIVKLEDESEQNTYSRNKRESDSYNNLLFDSINIKNNAIVCQEEKYMRYYRVNWERLSSLRAPEGALHTFGKKPLKANMKIVSIGGIFL